MTLSEVSPEPGEARTDTNDIKLPNGRDIYGTYKKAATHLNFYQWMPPFNLMYELVDEPLSPGQLQYIWNMISLVTALLLNVTLTAPLSLTYSDLQDLNDRFRNDSNMHKVFEQLATFDEDWGIAGGATDFYANQYSNRLLRFYTLSTGFLAASLLLVVLSSVLVTSMLRGDDGGEKDADGRIFLFNQDYMDWWSTCGRWLLLLQMVVGATGIILCTTFFCIMIDMKFPNVMWQTTGHMAPFFASLHTIKDSSLNSANTEMTILLTVVAVGLMLLSYGSTRKFLRAELSHMKPNVA